MRTTLLAAAVLLLVTGFARAAGATRYEGAGFAIDLPDGFDAEEGFTGQIYHLDVIRRDPAGGAGTAFLRLVVVPKTAMTADAVAERIVADFATDRVAKATLLETEETEVAVAGAKRAAKSRTYGTPGKPEFRVISAGIRDGEQKAALVALVTVESEAEDRALLDTVLAGLEIRAISEASLIAVRAATVRLRVPLVTRIAWTEETGRVVGQFQLPEGRMTLVIQDCRTVGRAEQAVARSHEDNAKSLELSAIRSGAEVLSRSMTAIPAGDDLLPGSAHRIALPGGQLRDQIVFPRQDGRLFVGFSFLCDAERREEMSARIAQVLGSLVRAAPPHRAPNLYVGRGLRIVHGSRDELTVDATDPDHPGFSLGFPGPHPPARILLDAGPPVPEEAAHERVLLGRGVPAEGRETTTGPVTMLGGEGTLRVTTYPDGDARRFVATATAPLGDGRLVATALGADHVRTDLLLALRFVVERLAATPGETDVRDGPVEFRFDPRVAELATSGSRTNRRIEIRGDRVRGSLVRLPTLVADPDARLAEQIRWADRDFEADETERGATEFTEPAREERTIDGRKILVSRRIFLGADGRRGAHVAFAAVLDGEFLRASVAVLDVDDAEATAAAVRILDTLRLR